MKLLDLNLQFISTKKKETKKTKACRNKTI